MRPVTVEDSENEIEKKDMMDGQFRTRFVFENDKSKTVMSYNNEVSSSQMSSLELRVRPLDNKV